MPKSSNVRIKEIAERLDLSVGTVSVVLNGRGDAMRISKATQERVRAVADEMNYQPNIYARRLRNTGIEKPARLIGVFWNYLYADEIMSMSTAFCRRRRIPKNTARNSPSAFFIPTSCTRTVRSSPPSSSTGSSSTAYPMRTRRS